MYDSYWPMINCGTTCQCAWQYWHYLTLHMRRIWWHMKTADMSILVRYDCALYIHILAFMYLMYVYVRIHIPVLCILSVSKWLVFQSCKKPQNCQINLWWIVANRCISFCRLPWRRLANRIVKHGAACRSVGSRIIDLGELRGDVWT